MSRWPRPSKPSKTQGKMWNLIIVMVFVPHCITGFRLVHSDDVDLEDDSIMSKESHERRRLNSLQIRCTRRYSPGTCLDEVRPVWTYNFHLQNCTERLGCRHLTVTNRFLSYKDCMESCQSLIQIYNHIMSQGSDWNDTERWAQEDSLRRYRGEEQPLVEEETEEDPPSRIDTHDPYAPVFFVERENMEQVELAEVIPADIDYQAPEYAHFDPLHQPIFNFN